MRGAITDADGRDVLLYAPCYVSNWCVNHCAYCGFRFDNDILRRQLELAEIESELAHLKGMGLKRVLLVASEYPTKVTVSYLEAAVAAAVKLGLDPDLEVAPLGVDAYRRLNAAGARGVVCYQETYDEASYRFYHPKGPKHKFGWRLDTAQRAAEAGMERIGMGVLLGLAEPERDVRAVAAHAASLLRRCPDVRVSISLPRLQVSHGGIEAKFEISDQQYVRLYSYLNETLPQVTLVVSTRETPAVRKAVLMAGVSQLSAGSTTRPGGYTTSHECGEQFRLSDVRPISEVERWLRGLGFEPRT